MARKRYFEVSHICGHAVEYCDDPRFARPVPTDVCYACESKIARGEMVAPVVTVAAVPVADQVAIDAPIHPLTHTAAGTVIAAIERGVDVEARFAAWNAEELSEEDDW